VQADETFFKHQAHSWMHYSDQQMAKLSFLTDLFTMRKS